MSFNLIQRRLDRIHNLPTLPTVLTKLQKATADPNSSAQDIAKIINDDPAIMTRILKVVNSAFYGSPANPINSLQLAVARLGMRAISNIALSTTIFSMFEGSGSEFFNRKEFWKHSICTGIAMKVIYDRCKNILQYRYDQDILQLTGLVHGIGKIVLDQYFHQEFVKSLVVSREEQISLASAEEKVINCNHAEIGAWLAGKWNLSSDVLQVIRWHLDPESADTKSRELAILCNISNYICNLEKLGNSGDSAAPSCKHILLKKLGIKISDITEIIDLIVAQSEMSEVLLSFVD